MTLLARQILLYFPDAPLSSLAKNNLVIVYLVIVHCLYDWIPAVVQIQRTAG